LLSFNPVPALTKVTCPVLGLYGALDNSSPVSLSVANMRGALAKGGNKDYTLKAFPNADHSLMVGNKNMAPGLFDTLSAWLLQRVHTDK
jgi:pimeloyl-ACP methyl ester carboxylesterase